MLRRGCRSQLSALQTRGLRSLRRQLAPHCRFEGASKSARPSRLGHQDPQPGQRARTSCCRHSQGCSALIAVDMSKATRLLQGAPLPAPTERNTHHHLHRTQVVHCCRDYTALPRLQDANRAAQAAAAQRDAKATALVSRPAAVSIRSCRPDQPSASCRG